MEWVDFTVFAAMTPITGSPLVPVLYVMIGIALSLVAVVALKPGHFRRSSANAAQTTGRGSGLVRGWGA
ncbi:hypothetical protein [Paraburkholderia heleia]|uniref:hypothetical protein n=1 Tax=Paraburkholderia heleia TaxID=634127 RepID=UPI0012ED2C50|nr:hypothetical protein [Paraburkholderia heleia]